MRSSLAIDFNLSPKKTAVVVPVKHISAFTQGVLVLIGTIAHWLHFNGIRAHANWAWNKGNVGKGFSWFVGRAWLMTRFTTVWALSMVFVWTDEATAGIDAAVVSHWLDSRQKLHS